MLITDYYRAVKIAKSPTRFDIDTSTEGYKKYEDSMKNDKGFNKGGLSFHFSKAPDNFKYRAKDKPDMAITKSENISGVFTPNAKLSFAHGDNKDTNDAILIILGKGEDGGVNQIEIFVCRGQKHNQRNLYFLMVDGELDEEMEYFRKKSKPKELPKQ
jgi:hypothetical protein